MFDFILWYINNITEGWAVALLIPHLAIILTFFACVADGLVDYLPKLHGKKYSCWVVGFLTYIATAPFLHIFFLMLLGYGAVKFYNGFISEWKST